MREFLCIGDGPGAPVSRATREHDNGVVCPTSLIFSVLACSFQDATVQQSPPSDSPSTTKDEPGGYVAPSLYTKVSDGCCSPDVENVGSPLCSINGDALGVDDPDGQDSAF